MREIKYYEVRGKVQGVMFRQTVIRACQKRGLECGATNDAADKNLVRLSIRGDDKKIDEFINDLQTTKPLNSWQAEVESIKRSNISMAITRHQVTTKNVDDFNWSSGVEFYL